LAGEGFTSKKSHAYLYLHESMAGQFWSRSDNASADYTKVDRNSAQWNEITEECGYLRKVWNFETMDFDNEWNVET
jgi:hypothetical protein